MSRINGPNEQNVKLIPHFPLNLKPKPTFCPDCFFPLSPAFALSLLNSFSVLKFLLIFIRSLFVFCLYFIFLRLSFRDLGNKIDTLFWHTMIVNPFSILLQEAKWCKNRRRYK